MVAVREVVSVFAVNVAVIVPLPLPEGVTVHQPELLSAVQPAFEVTVKPVLPAVAATLCVEGVTDRVADAPA